MANETLTTNLPGLVDDIRVQSFKYMTQEGVMKSLVTRTGGVGNSVTEPYFDPTATAGVAVGTEGTDYSTLRQITTTRRTYTASEWIMMSFLTDQSVHMSKEATRDFHAQAHGYEHAENLEKKLLAVFASFTTSITATSTSGLTWAKIAAARTNLENVPKSAPKPYALVCSPDAWYYFAQGTSGAANPYYVSTGTLADTIQQKYVVSSLVGGINVYQSAYFTQATTQNAGLFSKASISLFVPNDSEYKMEPQRDASKRGNELVSTFTFGARVRIPSYGIKLALYAKAPS